MKFFKFLIKFGINPETTIEDQQRYRIINSLAMVTGIIYLFYIIQNSIAGRWDHALLNVLFFIIIPSLTYFFRKKGNEKAALFILFYVLPGPAFSFYVVLYGDLGSMIYLGVIAMLYLFIENNWRISLFYLVYIIGCAISMEWIGNTIPPINPEFGHVAEHAYYINLFTSFFLVSFFMLRLKKEIKDKEKKIKAFTEELEMKLEREKEQKETITRLSEELNHRVKNNLQIISSLIQIQIANTEGAKAKQALQNIDHKILSLSLIHKQLQRTDDGYRIHVKQYLKELTDNLKINNTTEVKFVINVGNDDLELPVKEGVHLGLMVNELYTNTLKHGKINGLVFIQIIIQKSNDDQSIFLSYRDNGIGFPGSKNITDKGFGMGFIFSIAESYRGEVNYYNMDGAVIEAKLII